MEGLHKVVQSVYLYVKYSPINNYSGEIKY